jgi:peptidoglycan/LPS O-acetylase OafA/YrhL
MSCLPQTSPGVPSNPASDKLASLQLGRGVAAVAVIGFHTAAYMQENLQTNWLTWLFGNGNYGVPLFFAISGFIIMESSRESVRKGQGAGRFLLRRAIRIFPIFWIVYLCFSPLWFLAPDELGTKYHRDFSVWLKGLFLIPTLYDNGGFDIPHLGVAWTLVHEAIFYILFAVVIFWRSVGTLIMVGWFAACAFEAAKWGMWFKVTSLHEILIHPFNLWFLCGVTGFWVREVATRLISVVLKARIHFAVIGLLVAAYMLMKFSMLTGGQYDAAITGLLLVYFGSLGPNVVERLAQRYRATTVFGDASYSLYLAHVPILAVLNAIVVRTITGPIGAFSYILFICQFAIALAGGFLLYRFAEKPILDKLRVMARDRNQSSHSVPHVTDTLVPMPNASNSHSSRLAP